MKLVTFPPFFFLRPSKSIARHSFLPFQSTNLAMLKSAMYHSFVQYTLAQESPNWIRLAKAAALWFGQDGRALILVRQGARVVLWLGQGGQILIWLRRSGEPSYLAQEKSKSSSSSKADDSPAWYLFSLIKIFFYATLPSVPCCVYTRAKIIIFTALTQLFPLILPTAKYSTVVMQHPSLVLLIKESVPV